MALKMKCLTVLCFVLATFVHGMSFRSIDNENLLAVVQIFRHGLRTPTEFYTNDPYSNRSFWDGLDLGQLTNVGKVQHYQLGRFSRNRYGDWLSIEYDRNEFYAQTTDVDRTHMSAQANTYGLYPARGDEIWKPRLDWQPIPIHPADPDVIASFPNCPNYLKEYANVLASNYFVSLNKLYAPVYAYLSNKSGDAISTFLEAESVYDCLRIENDVGLKLPDWSRLVYPKPLKNISGYLFESQSYSTKLQRLGAGPLLNEIFKYFDNVSKNNTKNPKYKVYSGHDSNIALVLKTLGAFNPPYPPAFASSIYFELRRRDGDFYVNVWSKNDDNFKPIYIRECDFDCALSEAKTKLSDILIDVKARNVECTENFLFANDAAEDRYKKLITSGELDKLINMF